MCKQKYKYKDGELLSDILPKLRPFDAIFFKGNSAFSSVIKLFGKTKKRVINQCDFTHVGVIVTSDILLHDNILPNRKYILESIVGGIFAHNIKDINQKTFSGVQIRDLEEVISAYDIDNSTQVAYGLLINNPIDTIPFKNIKEKFTEFYAKYYGKNYDMNPYSLASSACSCLRPCRTSVETFCNTDDYYFCSEIITILYKYFGIYPESVNEKDVLPMDIAYSELDKDNNPKIMRKLIFITTLIHYIPKNKCNNVKRLKIKNK